MREMPLVRKLTPGFLTGYLEMTANTIYKFRCQNHGNDEDSKEKAIEEIKAFLIDWLSNQWEEFPSTVTRIYTTSDRVNLDVKFWEQVSSCSKHGGKLLSIQRHLQGNTMTNVSMPVLTAKLQLYGPDTVLPADVHDVITK